MIQPMQARKTVSVEIRFVGMVINGLCIELLFSAEGCADLFKPIVQIAIFQGKSAWNGPRRRQLLKLVQARDEGDMDNAIQLLRLSFQY